MQSRAMSAIEALTNVFAGWFTAFTLQLVLFPALGLQATVAQNLLISGAFTALSLMRSYILRRVFVALELAPVSADQTDGDAQSGFR